MIEVRLTGNGYANRIASYILRNFENRGVKVYREVSVGKTIIGKNRRIDVMVVHEEAGRALAIECKYQDLQGTADEKIPYALEDMEALRVHMPGIIVYSGDGMSDGILHLLQASPHAAFCHPENDLAQTKDTMELDHLIAMTFGWWDILLGSKKAFAGDVSV